MVEPWLSMVSDGSAMVNHGLTLTGVPPSPYLPHLPTSPSLPLSPSLPPPSLLLCTSLNLPAHMAQWLEWKRKDLVILVSLV
jgi:hypothetical protein